MKRHHNHKHGHNRRDADGRNRPTPTYRSWQAMLNRCRNSKGDKFQGYGARGIHVTKRWYKFEQFLADMGERPAGTTLERRKNRRGYTPANCYWATPKEQGRNRGTTHWIVFRGKRCTLSEWAAEIDVTPTTLLWRLNAGWPKHRALTVAGTRPRWITFQGERLTLSEWATRIGIRPTTLCWRFKTGWSKSRALTAPGRR